MDGGSTTRHSYGVEGSDETDEGRLSVELPLEIQELQMGRAEASITSRALRLPSGSVRTSLFAAAGELLVVEAATKSAPEARFSTRRVEASLHEVPSTEFLHVIAELEHRGRSSENWNVEFRDEGGRICARVEVLLSVRTGLPASES